MQRCEFSLIEKQVKETIEKVSDLLKTKRENNNANENCAYLVKYTICALENLFAGIEPPNEEIPTDSSVNTAENTARLGFVTIKDENGHKKKQLRTLSITAYRQLGGLNSILPPSELSYLIENDDQFALTTYIDLEATAINKKCVKLAELEGLFKEQAKREMCVLIGHIGLTSIGRSQMDHVIGFCATENKIYYIDGQLYDGIKHAGCPVFENLSSQFNFTTQCDFIPQGNVADDCFYLIHRKIPYSLIIEKLVKEEKAAENDNAKVANQSSLSKRKFSHPKKEKGNKKRKMNQDNSEQNPSPEKQDRQIKVEKITDTSELENIKNEDNQTSNNEKIDKKISTFEEIMQAINQANNLARIKGGEIKAINIFRAIIADIKILKQYVDEKVATCLSVRECHCYYQILQCQKNAGFLSLAMPQVIHELKALMQKLNGIIHHCQAGIPCSERDTYTISMANSAKNAISALLHSATRNIFVIAEFNLVHGAKLKEYIVKNRINKLKKHFRFFPENATVFDYIIQSVELLDSARNCFKKLGMHNKVADCNNLILDLKNLLKHFSPMHHTFFDSMIETRHNILNGDNGGYNEDKEKLPHLI